jgi:hypothetical protein
MHKKIEEHYINLMEEFFKRIKQKIKDEKLKNIPSIHIPVIGNYYEKENKKIAIYGIETNYLLWKYNKKYKKYWKNIAELKRKYDRSPKIAYSYLTEWQSCDAYNLTHENGASFFDYVLHLLKRIYGLKDIIDKDLKYMEKNYPNISQSFILGNIHSFERDRENKSTEFGIDSSIWNDVKEASKIFDETSPDSKIIGPSYIVNEYKPNLLLILNKDFNCGKWIKEAYGIDKLDEIDEANHLYYAYIKETNTHILKHMHPTEINYRIQYKTSFNLIENTIKEKKIINVKTF